MKLKKKELSLAISFSTILLWDLIEKYLPKLERKDVSIIQEEYLNSIVRFYNRIS